MNRDQLTAQAEAEEGRQARRPSGEGKRTLSAFQRLVAAWGTKTFPYATADSITNHLAEEMIELLGEERVKAALYRVTRGSTMDDDYPPTDNPAEECADILLMLLHLAHRFDFDLMEEAQKKFTEVKDAQWEDNEGRGYLKRVKP